MVRFIVLIIGLVVCSASQSQVQEMSWKLDYRVYMRMANDSNYAFDIRNAFHVAEGGLKDFDKDMIFYPVKPGEQYAKELEANETNDLEYNTLWSALHDKIGGGWIHFANCILYALETRMLIVDNPGMLRPVTNWKPDSITEAYKRTKKWDYYIPIDMRHARKEYKIRQKNGTLNELEILPRSYIDLFLETNNKEYKQLLGDRKFMTIAKIDLVKIILGARYLGKEQINYISNAVLNSIKSYTVKKLPTIVIFDEYDAATAMSLGLDGYKIESIAFREDVHLSEAEKRIRKKRINDIIERINNYNKEAFKKKLKTHYQ